MSESFGGIQILDSTTWFRIWQFQTNGLTVAPSKASPGERFSSWGLMIGVFWKRESRLIWHRSRVSSRQLFFFFCLHIYSLWYEHIILGDLIDEFNEKRAKSTHYHVTRSKRWNDQGSRVKKKSFEPDLNQRPMDHSKVPSTVHRSTNWAIEGRWILAKNQVPFYPSASHIRQGF